jgi:predicted ATPase
MKKSMLHDIRLWNFKAIQDSGVVRLTPLTVFIGNNGSGKSSIIEGLETLKTIVGQDLDTAMQRWRGFEKIWNQAVVHKPKEARVRTAGRREQLRPYQTDGMVFQLRGAHADRSWSASLEVNLEPGGNELFIRHEYLNARRSFTVKRDAMGYASKSERHSSIPATYRVGNGKSALAEELKPVLARWQFLSLHPDSMGFPVPQRRTGDEVWLARDGANIAEYLLHIRELDSAAFDGIVETLQYVLPYARDVQPTLASELERMVYLQLTEQEFKVPGWLLSTGTLRILALLAVLRHPDPPSLLVIEELENGLDPRTLNLVVEEIRRVVELGTIQVIITTHSPYLLDLLDLSQIVMVERVGGAPVFSRPEDHGSLRIWAEDFAPGRLYTMGRLSKGTAS